MTVVVVWVVVDAACGVMLVLMDGGVGSTKRVRRSRGLNFAQMMRWFGAMKVVLWRCSAPRRAVRDVRGRRRNGTVSCGRWEGWVGEWVFRGSKRWMVRMSTKGKSEGKGIGKMEVEVGIMPRVGGRGR